MTDIQQSIDLAMKDVDRLRRLLKGAPAQIRSVETRAIIKAVCLTWFNNHRPEINSVLEGDLLSPADAIAKQVLLSTDHATVRTRYESLLKAFAQELSSLRGYTIGAPLRPPVTTADTPPNFAALVSDPKMQSVLTRRWNECAKCASMNAPLAATVMMGGLLEALLLARVLREPKKNQVFASSKAPKDPTTQKTAQLQDWTLRHYLDVAQDLGWISSSAKDVGEVVRDYRNYIHPHKELSHGVVLGESDAALFWEIAKSIARQLLT